MNPIRLEKIDWQKESGKIPAIIQHASTLQVLMLGYMTPESLKQTLETERVTFYSRSKNRLWVKGESSGNYLKLIDIQLDCDQDTLLIFAEPEGPTCHNGTDSCLMKDVAKIKNFYFLSQLEQIISVKKNSPDPKSYTASLFQAGIARMAQKVGEEGVEVALAAVQQQPEGLLNESADLIYHLLVLLNASDFGLADVIHVLHSRHRI